MTASRVRRVFTIAFLAGGLASLLRVLRGAPAPAFERNGERTGPRSDPPRSGPTATPASAPVAPDEEVARGEQAAPVVEPEPEAVPTGGAVPAWVPPVDGACPDGYPVKVKLRSGIYHLPGGGAYARTVPDRCYPTAEAAAADGFRSPKR